MRAFPVLVFFFFQIVAVFGQSQDEALFEIIRNKDEHRIIYHLNTNRSGKLNSDEPIGAYWLRQSGDESCSKSLNALERKYAYGLNFLEVDDDQARFRFVSYKKRDFVLAKDSKGKYAVFGTIAGQWAKLTSIFLHLDGGTFWFPNVSFIRLNALDQNGNHLSEIVHDP